MFGFVRKSEYEALKAQYLEQVEISNYMDLVADLQRGLMLDLSKEVSSLKTELARWKPDRDEKGHFVRRAIMPEIRDRDCSFIERGE